MASFLVSTINLVYLIWIRIGA